MIVSFKHNFVFIKTQKTAGTSIEIILTPHCGPEDILTPIAPRDERLRLIDGKLQARNYTADFTLEAALREALRTRDRAMVARIMIALGRGGEHFYNHMSAAEAEAKLPAKFWRNAVKFTILRHPYERAVSLAYYNARVNGEPPEALVDRYLPAVSKDVLRYTRDGKLMVDAVIRYDHLKSDLDRIAGRIGLPPLGQLPRAKAGFRTDRTPAHQVLSDRQKQILQETCRLEFALFGYEP